VAITPEENLAELRRIKENARGGAAAAATAMAKYIRDRVRNDTLQRSYHAPGAFNRQKPGRPPARASGALADAMYFKPAYGGMRATALVGNKSDYGRILEYGCVITPKNGVYLGWRDSGRPDNPSGIWRHRSVNVPPHPYLRPTVEDAIEDWELRRVAVEAFEPYDP
jgi:hypothetical protein